MGKFYRFTLAVLFSFITTQLSAALNGAYTINPAAAASATNYLTFASAVSDMQSGTRADGGPIQGPSVTGPVVFTVSAATYNEQVVIVNIPGASAVNTVTFNGVSAATCVVTRNSTVIYDATVVLNGADWIRFQNLTIQNTGTTYGYGFVLIAQADNNQIKDCIISLPITATGTYQTCISAADVYTAFANNANNLLIENNTITGGTRSIVLNGISSAYASNNIIRNNTISQAYNHGIYVNYQNGLTVEKNTITMRTTLSSSYGAYIRYVEGITINANRIHSCGTYGIYMQSLGLTTTAYSYIRNNMIGGNFYTTATAYGIYFTTGNYVSFYHNSISMNAATTLTSARAIYILGTNSNIELLNNSFATSVTGATSYAFYCASTAGFISINYNNYYSAGSNLAYHLANYPTLASWQTGQPTFNPNSQSGWPNYFSNTDLHSGLGQLNNWAMPIASEVTDFDGQPRPLPPDLTKDVGADEFNIAAFDLDIQAITAPLVLAMGNNTVSFTLINNGANSLNGQTVSMQYSTDGGSTWPVSQNFTLTTLGATGNTQAFSFTTQWNVSVAGSYTLCVRINPVYPGDADASDQTCISACTGMNGPYTVNPGLPTSGTNFNNFADLSAALGSCGVGGPVTVTVSAGTYNTAVIFPNILGSSATNTVTIDGVSAAACTLSVNISTANGSAMRLNGSDYMIIRNMTIDCPGLYGFGVHITNDANYNQVRNCVITQNPTSTSTYHIPVLISGTTYATYGNNGDYNLIQDNVLSGGYYGVRMNGGSTTVYDINNKVIGNTITNFYYYGVYSYYCESTEIIDNLIYGGAITNTSSYGIYMYYGDKNFRIENNTIRTIGLRGMFLSLCNQSALGTGRIVNNMVGADFYSAGSVSGIYLSSVKNTQIYHNSVNIGGMTGYAFYASGTGTTVNLDLKNNIFACAGSGGGTGYTMYFAGIGFMSASNYNNLYSNGSNLVWHNGSYTTLAAYQASFPAYEQNSVSIQPGFVGMNNLHIVCSAADNLGTPLASVPADIDGNARSLTTPDIGADEFTAITVSVNLGPDSSHCGPYVLTVDSSWVSANWMGLGSGPSFQVDSTGLVYVDVIDTNNCRASDTVNLVILDFPSPVYASDTVYICPTDTLDAENPGSTYLWSNGVVTQTQNPPAAGWYWVDITNPSGCVLRDSVLANFNAQPVVNLGNDTTFCLGGSATINPGNQPLGSTFNWSTGATTQVVLVSSPGTYWLEVTSPAGCYSTDTVVISGLTSPIVSLGADGYQCDVIFLDADPGGNNPGASYQWNTGPLTQTITTTTPGTFMVTVTNPNGCVTSDTAVIGLGTTPNVNLGPDAIICDNVPLVLDAGFPTFDHLWSNNATTQTITITTPTTYIVQVTDPNTNCMGSDTIVVTASALSVDLGPDQILCTGSSLVLDAGSGGTGYVWSTGDLSQTLTVTSGGTYSVTVADAFGCNAIDQIVITTATPPTAVFTGPGSIPLWQPAQFNDASTGGVTTWFWDFGDGSTSTQQNPSHSYVAMGTFTVCLTVDDGTCTNTSCSNITVGAPIGIDDETLAAGLSIYPNPSDGIFHLGIDLMDPTLITFEVFALDGRMLLSKTINSLDTQQDELDLSNQSAGFYILKVNTPDGRELIRKLIRN